MLTLEFFIKALSGQHLGSTTPISRVVIDSRQAGPDALFVALPGEHADGHDYVADALARGARAALVSRRPDLDTPVIYLAGMATIPLTVPRGPVLLHVEDTLTALQRTARAWFAQWSALPGRSAIGITGSVGKTTTKEALAALLAERFTTLKSEASYNNEIGLPLTVFGLRGVHERAVLEMGFYVPGEIALLCSIAPPRVGVVTMIAPVHLERAGSMQAIVDGKAELVEALPPDGVAVLNGDDPLVMSMAKRTRARVVTFGLKRRADLRATEIVGLGLDGVRFRLHHTGESRVITLPLPGRHNVMTALAAAAVGFVEGLTWDEVVRGLEKPRPQIRLVPVEGPHGSTILDDTYNASPHSVIAALDLLHELPGRHIAVLGDMLELGSYEAEGHQRVGEHAARTAEVLVTVGMRGRLIASAARKAGLKDVTECSGAEEAAAHVRTLLSPGDRVLVKGSRAVGMERVVRLLLADHQAADNNPLSGPTGSTPTPAPRG
ncbi:MAG: UDP-N-acetylmuramoyl-tripeptide--D-alanyl-D-alanine ligase [Anaerolineae bacterium]